MSFKYNKGNHEETGKVGITFNHYRQMVEIIAIFLQTQLNPFLKVSAHINEYV